MPKNRSTLFLFCMMFTAVTSPVYAQVMPSANAHQPKLIAGGFGSVFQPDYAGNGIAQPSPNPLVGIGAFVDYRINRYVGVEAEGSWLHFNKYIGISEDTYLIGPKINIHEFGRFTPYGKFLVGMGGGSFLNGHTTVLSYGGGVDYNLSSHWMLRAGDFEFQQWMVTPQLHPYGGSVGSAYKIFR
jgi:opacity protein-like surface antigen